MTAERLSRERKAEMDAEHAARVMEKRINARADRIANVFRETAVRNGWDTGVTGGTIARVIAEEIEGLRTELITLALGAS